MLSMIILNRDYYANYLLGTLNKQVICNIFWSVKTSSILQGISCYYRDQPGDIIVDITEYHLIDLTMSRKDLRRFR
jgi:hypothetical protein